MGNSFEFIIHKWPVGWCGHDGCHEILTKAEQQSSVQEMKKTLSKHNRCTLLARDGSMDILSRQLCGYSFLFLL